MIGRHYTLDSQEVDKPPIELDTKSIYRAVVMMQELGYKLELMNTFSCWANFSKGNERVIVEWE